MKKFLLLTLLSNSIIYSCLIKNKQEGVIYTNVKYIRLNTQLIQQPVVEHLILRYETTNEKSINRFCQFLYMKRVDMLYIIRTPKDMGLKEIDYNNPDDLNDFIKNDTPQEMLDKENTLDLLENINKGIFKSDFTPIMFKNNKFTTMVSNDYIKKPGELDFSVTYKRDEVIIEHAFDQIVDGLEVTPSTVAFGARSISPIPPSNKNNFDNNNNPLNFDFLKFKFYLNTSFEEIGQNNFGKIFLSAIEFDSTGSYDLYKEKQTNFYSSGNRLNIFEVNNEKTNQRFINRTYIKDSYENSNIKESNEALKTIEQLNMIFKEKTDNKIIRDFKESELRMVTDSLLKDLNNKDYTIDNDYKYTLKQIFQDKNKKAFFTVKNNYNIVLEAGIFKINEIGKNFFYKIIENREKYYTENEDYDDYDNCMFYNDDLRIKERLEQEKDKEKKRLEKEQERKRLEKEQERERQLAIEQEKDKEKKRVEKEKERERQLAIEQEKEKEKKRLKEEQEKKELDEIGNMEYKDNQQTNLKKKQPEKINLDGSFLLIVAGGILLVMLCVNGYKKYNKNRKSKEKKNKRATRIKHLNKC